jgi:peroxiredoxin
MKKTIAAVLGVFMLAAFAAPTWAARANEGDAVPEFSVSMLSGKTMMSADLAKNNKTFLITFIQTACSSCKGEIIMLNKLAKESKSKIFVLPVAVDMRSGKDFLENYKSENAVDFDFGIDPKFSIPLNFGISFTPATVVIKDGKVAKIFRGYDDEIQKELTALFK